MRSECISQGTYTSSHGSGWLSADFGVREQEDKLLLRTRIGTGGTSRKYTRRSADVLVKIAEETIMHSRGDSRPRSLGALASHHIADRLTWMMMRDYPPRPYLPPIHPRCRQSSNQPERPLGAIVAVLLAKNRLITDVSAIRIRFPRIVTPLNGSPSP